LTILEQLSTVAEELREEIQALMTPHRAVATERSRPSIAEPGEHSNPGDPTTSEARLRLLAAFSPVGVLLTAADGTCLFATEKAEQLVGQPLAGVVLTRDFLRVVHSSDRPELAHQLEASHVSREPFVSRLRIVRADGSWIWVELAASPITASGDANGGRVLVLRDVTVEVEATNAERLAAARLEGVLQAASDAIVALDEQGHVVQFNRAAELAFECERGEVLGRAWDSIVPPTADREAYRALFAGGIGEAEGRDLMWHRRKSGTFLLFEVGVWNVEIDDQRLVTAVFRDVTDKHAAESSLREAHERLRSAFDHSPLGMALLCPSGRLLQVNQALSNFIGYAPETLIGMEFRTLSHPDDIPVEVSLIKDLLAGRRDSYQIEKRCIRADGEVVWGRVNVSIVRDDEGHPLHYVAQVQDISELKRLEQELRHAQTMEAIGRFAAGLAHDFNNTLAIIGGHVDLALTGPHSAVPARLEKIRDAVHRAARFGDDLLAFGREHVDHSEIVDLHHAIESLLPQIEALAGERVRLSFRSVTEPALVRIDPLRLERVIVNLTSNALTAMPDGGSLTIEVARRVDDAGRGAVHVAVSDTGVGMDVETADRVFEPFFTTRGRSQGSGLGLAIVDGIITAAGGRVWASSIVGVGSTFTVSLPCVDAAPPATPSTEEHAATLKPRPTVLVVDDDDHQRSLMVEILSAQEYNVLSAADGVEALEVARRSDDPIDVLVTDLSMPVMDGVELADMLTAERPEMAVTFVSGYRAARMCTFTQIDRNFLAKPFQAWKLVAKVEDLITRSRASRREAIPRATHGDDPPRH
jgi:PAS domain S-box-containing protein